MDATGDAGYMTVLAGDTVGAAKLFAESLSLAVDLEARDRISWALLGAGNVAAAKGDAPAVRLFAAAAAIQQVMQEDFRPSVDAIQERILTEQRQQLGESDYRAAWEEGRSPSPSEPLRRPKRVRRGLPAARGLIFGLAGEALPR